MSKILLLSFSFSMIISFKSYTKNTYLVPKTIKFIDLTLYITNEAKNAIQKKVDDLTRSQVSLDILSEKASLFFPLIEKVLKDEGVHDDFKYLVIQESGLIGNCITNVGATGYWQFKKDAALEMGLIINNEVDERMHIIHATKAAAKYLSTNNKKYFNNWIYALLSYYQGAGGALKIIDKKYCGKKSMVINKDTHWYIIHFLAHKIVFEKIKYKQHSKLDRLNVLHGISGLSIKEITNKLNIELKLFKEYNSWIKKDIIPSDRNYSIIVPITYNGKTLLENNYNNLFNLEKDYYTKRNKSHLFPTISKITNSKVKLHERVININGLLGIIAKKGDNINCLCKIGNISYEKFLEYNDLQKNHIIIPNQAYYISSKNSKAKSHYHIATDNESLWSIAQKYGITISSLLTKNRFTGNKDIKIKNGTVLWLRFIRPKNIPITYIEHNN